MQAKILRLNMAGQPIEWVDWQTAVCLMARDLVNWHLGDVVRTVWGGHSRLSGEQTRIELPSIMICVFKIL